MIYKKVPAIDNKVIQEALNYNSKHTFLAQTTYDGLLSKHSKYALRDGKRAKSLWEVIKLYYYIVDTQRGNSAYQAYKETMEEILFQGGLITQYQSGLPMDQFINRSIERITVEALKELYPEDELEVYNSGSGQDFGIDFIWNGQKVDVKASKHRTFIRNHYNLGSIKYNALKDKTKQTELILWAGNLVELGYVCLIGIESWEDVKKQIEDKDGWREYFYTEFELPMNKKCIKNLKGECKFPNRFFGGIDNATQRQMVKERS